MTISERGLTMIGGIHPKIVSIIVVLCHNCYQVPVINRQLQYIIIIIIIFMIVTVITIEVEIFLTATKYKKQVSYEY